MTTSTPRLRHFGQNLPNRDRALRSPPREAAPRARGRSRPLRQHLLARTTCTTRTSASRCASARDAICEKPLVHQPVEPRRARRSSSTRPAAASTPCCSCALHPPLHRPPRGARTRARAAARTRSCLTYVHARAAAGTTSRGRVSDEKSGGVATNMRIVSLIASSTEIVCALGDGDRAGRRARTSATFRRGSSRCRSLTRAEVPDRRHELRDRQRVKAIVQEGARGLSRRRGGARGAARPTSSSRSRSARCARSSTKDVEAAVCQIGAVARRRIVSLEPNALDDIWRDIRARRRGARRRRARARRSSPSCRRAWTRCRRARAHGRDASDGGVHRVDRAAHGRGQLDADAGRAGGRHEPLRRGRQAFAVDDVGRAGRARSRVIVVPAVRLRHRATRRRDLPSLERQPRLARVTRGARPGGSSSPTAISTSIGRGRASSSRSRSSPSSFIPSCFRRATPDAYIAARHAGVAGGARLGRRERVGGVHGVDVDRGNRRVHDGVDGVDELLRVERVAGVGQVQVVEREQAAPASAVSRSPPTVMPPRTSATYCLKSTMCRFG